MVRVRLICNVKTKNNIRLDVNSEKETELVTRKHVYVAKKIVIKEIPTSNNLSHNKDTKIFNHLFIQRPIYVTRENKNKNWGYK